MPAGVMPAVLADMVVAMVHAVMAMVLLMHHMMGCFSGIGRSWPESRHSESQRDSEAKSGKDGLLHGGCSWLSGPARRHGEGPEATSLQEPWCWGGTVGPPFRRRPVFASKRLSAVARMAAAGMGIARPPS